MGGTSGGNSGFTPYACTTKMAAKTASNVFVRRPYPEAIHIADAYAAEGLIFQARNL